MINWHPQIQTNHADHRCINIAQLSIRDQKYNDLSLRLVQNSGPAKVKASDLMAERE